MASEDVIAIIRAAIEQSVRPAGIARMPIMSESGDQVARDVADALDDAGYEIVRRGDGK